MRAGWRGASRTRDERAAALVELAIVLPLVIALILGLFTGGMAYNRKITIVNAAREASRYGATLPVSKSATPGAPRPRFRAAESWIMLRNGVIPMPPARKIAGFVTLWWSVNDPIGPSASTGVASGAEASTRLNALFRIRVAMTRSVSCGALVIENVRVFPSVSVSGGSTRVRSSV